MKIVVTGGAGFIGANLCRELLRRPGFEVVVLDNLSTGRLDNLSGLRVEVRIGSVLDHGAVSAACAGAGSIVHAADPGRGRDADAFGMATVLEVARETGAHVVICSHTVPQQVPAGSQCCAFRLSHVFGPLQNPWHPRAVIPSLICDALRGRPLTVHGDGAQLSDFTFVTSAVEVLAEAVECRMAKATPVNLAFGTPASINEVVTILSDLLGHSLDVDYLPPRGDEVSRRPPEPSELPVLFPAIRPVPLAHGLLRTLSWLERHVAARPGKDEVPA
ncbi:NAD-dependent epimerase/dehydratase family protein [Amycolatopsis taiwanensis]|uniref:NAD-dependent epimerase/dehydratase family protein n=1 Tax=Amycolatopsis taiwanensis TaxID=342230 RepID=UPI0004844272|nr:NAD-dependent epimerase/dehydratase family protein [Amycolatopsis taiwanensis]